MLESIEIKNFRCFKETKIAQFGLVNLLGGMNNVGKTALLEAIYLAKNPYIKNIMALHDVVRSESTKFAQAMPENKWDNFYYQQDTEQTIKIDIKDNEVYRSIVLTCDEQVSDFISLTGNEKSLNPQEISEYVEKLEQQSHKSALHINVVEDVREIYKGIIIASETSVAKIGSLSTEKEMAYFVLANQRESANKLAEEYEKARFNSDEKVEKVLQALQLIDNSIENVQVYLIGEPIIYVKRFNEKRMPLTLFGDAMNKVAHFVLKMINNPNTAILIDEIENGIHFTNQEKLWNMLFKLAIEYKIQIFSSTHSLEMIKAFVRAAQEFPEHAAYFEMARNPRTSLIKVIKHDLSTLLFELDRNIGIRGD